MIAYVFLNRCSTCAFKINVFLRCHLTTILNCQSVHKFNTCNSTPRHSILYAFSHLLKTFRIAATKIFFLSIWEIDCNAAFMCMKNSLKIKLHIFCCPFCSVFFVDVFERWPSDPSHMF